MPHLRSLLWVSCLVALVSACPEDKPGPISALVPDVPATEVAAADGVTPDAVAEVTPDGAPVPDAVEPDADPDAAPDSTTLPDALADVAAEVGAPDGSAPDSAAIDDSGPEADDGNVAEDVTAEVDAGPPPTPDCGLWPLVAEDFPGPGDVDFPYGFAAGAVRSDGVVLVAPTEGPASVRVIYKYGPNCDAEVTDWVPTSADKGFVAHIPLTDLYPHQVYRYALEIQDGAGLTSYGWFVTAPVADSPVRLAFSGDIGTSGSYAEVYDEIITTGAELLLNLGDWPYADLNGAAVSLEDYRDKHRDHRVHPGIQAMMRFLPIHGTWDDHEIINDWDGANTAGQPQRVADGMQAWREFFPIADNPAGEIYRVHSWGPNIDAFWLDLRSHRDANSAPNDASKTMMGTQQFTWLKQALSASTAAFKLIMTSVPLDYGTTGDDHWPGFAYERDQLVAHIVDNGITGALFLTADQHWLAVHHFQHGIKEFQVGPLSQFLRTPDDDVPPWVLIQDAQRNYGLLDYLPATADGPATLTFTAHGDDGALLWTETVQAGRGTITVEAASPFLSWRIVGAHTFYGAGSAEIDYAVPGEYTIEWLTAAPGDLLPEDETLTLADATNVTFSDGSGGPLTPIFEDDFSGAALGSQWQAVDQGVNEPASNWQLIAGAANETGNCYDYITGQSVVPKRGTFLWNDSVVFGEGLFVAHMYHGDDDSMGLMYGIQSTDTYYRVSVDVQRSFARLVRVDGDLFTVLAEDLDFAPPEATWYTLAVEREGDTHNVYFDGQPILTATDAAYGSGTIALYCYGMEDGRFDNVALYP